VLLALIVAGLSASTVLLDGSALSGVDLSVRILRANADLQSSSSDAQSNVLSFLVTFFFARAKKEVTRSAAGRVEAPLRNQIQKSNANVSASRQKPTSS
jgi:hypothetical protein